MVAVLDHVDRADLRVPGLPRDRAVRYQRVGTSREPRARRPHRARPPRARAGRGACSIEREKGADPCFTRTLLRRSPSLYAESEGRRAALPSRALPLRAPGAPPVGLEIVTYGAIPRRPAPGLALSAPGGAAAARSSPKRSSGPSPRSVVDNVALFLARYHTRRGATRPRAGTRPAWRSLDQLPDELVLTVSLLEPGEDGQTRRRVPSTRARSSCRCAPFKLLPGRRRGRRHRLRRRHDREAVRRVVPASRSTVRAAPLGQRHHAGARPRSPTSAGAPSSRPRRCSG